MPGLVLAGQTFDVPGLEIVNWHDDPRLRLRAVEDMRARRTGERVRMVVLHTTKGIPGGRDRRPQDIRPGLGPRADAALRCARSWSLDGRHGGAHLVVDHDGSVACLADLQREVAYHVGGAPGLNGASVGVEAFQGSGAELYECQIAAVVTLCGALARLLGVERVVPPPYRGRPVEALRSGARGWSGFLGHRDCDANRGAGDPGDAIMDALVAAGWTRGAS